MVVIDGQSVQPSDRVKLLVVHVDNKLRFQNYNSVIYSRPSRQINAMDKFSNFVYLPLV